MSKAEITAYNYGRRLAQETLVAVESGEPWEPPPAALLTPEEQAALQAIGQDAWWRFVMRGGQEILEAPHAVP